MFHRIDDELLAHVTGGFDIPGLISTIGGLADKFGAKGKGSQIAGTINGFIGKFMPQGAGGGGAPQADQGQ